MENEIKTIQIDGNEAFLLNVIDKGKPKAFAYVGDINLLYDIKNNIAVIGTLTPSEEIREREDAIVAELVKMGKTIVSGLAEGCDTIAHEKCLENGGKTIAILPTTLDKIYPSKNKELAKKIIESGGLVLTEYFENAKSRLENIKRFIERDRLQAMICSAVILIASCRKGEGDSGSRHAMQKAKMYGRERYVMFDSEADKNNLIFGLNEDLIALGGTNVLTRENIKLL